MVWAACFFPLQVLLAGLLLGTAGQRKPPKRCPHPPCFSSSFGRAVAAALLLLTGLGDVVVVMMGASEWRMSLAEEEGEDHHSFPVS